METGGKAYLLFAHGARNPDWANPVLAIRDAMRARRPGARIEAAFLEFIIPLLPDAIDALVDAGQRHIVVVPLFMAQSGHTQRDLPALVAAARNRHPQLILQVATPIGEAPQVVTAIAEYALGV